MTTSSKLAILGLAGTNGSGKDTFGQLLADHHNYLFVSVTDLLRAECARRQLPVEREYLRMISAEWRRELGLGVLVDKAIAEYEAAKADYRGVVMASLRNPGEADRLHDFGGTLVWLDADPEVRYNRVQNASRGRSEEDDKTFEQFLAEENAEMHSHGDAATLDMSAVKAKADIFIDNTTENLEAFRQDIDETLGL